MINRQSGEADPINFISTDEIFDNVVGPHEVDVDLSARTEKMTQKKKEDVLFCQLSNT